MRTNPRLTPINKPLSDKQILFCKEYVLDCDATAAARRAGYKNNSANEQGAAIKSLPAAAKLIAELMEARTRETGINAEWVLKNLRTITEYCMSPKTFDATGALRALELIGRHIGFFEKDNLTRPPVTINLTAIDIKYSSDRLEEIV